MDSSFEHQSPVERTNFCYPLNEVQSALDQITTAIPFQRDQICLTSSRQIKDRLYGGAGFHDGSRIDADLENTFTIFNKEFQGTIFEQIYNDVNSTYNGYVRRVRFMRLRSCSSIPLHTDKAYNRLKLHMAIYTEQNVFLMFWPKPVTISQGRAFHVPADGFLYQMDPQVPHTAVNASLKDRVHLIFNIFDDGLS